MGNAKKRGTHEERVTEAVAAGREKQPPVLKTDNNSPLDAVGLRYIREVMRGFNVRRRKRLIRRERGS